MSRDQTMLYRPGSQVNPEAWNLEADTLIVDDEDIEAAKAEGWMVAADFHESLKTPAPTKREPGPYDSILDASVKDITPLLIDMSLDELREMRAAEEGGKTRAGLLSEIDKAIEAKGA